MPAIQINFEDIILDPKVQTYCNSPKLKCPNYNHSWACPPEAPYMENKISQFDKFFLIYYKFDLKTYVKEVKRQFSNRNEDSIINLFFRKEIIRDYLEKEIREFLKTYKENYNDKLILWDGYCRVCYKEGTRCTYDIKKPCRYPSKIRYSMEAVGIDVDKTVKNLNVALEWPPINYTYRFGLVCFK